MILLGEIWNPAKLKNEENNAINRGGGDNSLNGFKFTRVVQLDNNKTLPYPYNSPMGESINPNL